MEEYAANLVEALAKRREASEVIVLTRRFRGTKAFEKRGKIVVRRVPFLRGFWLRNVSFNAAAFAHALFLDFDVLITNDLIASFLGVFLARLKGMPQIAVCHGLASAQSQYPFFVRWALAALEKIAFNCATVTVTHCPRKMIEPVTRKYVVIKPGLDKKRLKKDFSLRKEFGLKPGVKVIVFVGRLVKVKGVEYLLNALPSVEGDWVCFIVGDGPQKRELVELSNELGLRKKIVFAGFRRDVNRFLSIADAFVLPSESEAMAYSLVEAAFMRTPIVATDVGVIPRNAALVVPKQSPQAIARALNKLFREPALAKKIAGNAFEYAKEFDWERAARDYARLLHGLARARFCLFSTNL